MPQKKKPVVEETQYYNADEVQDALNNATLALLRWDRLKDFKSVRGNTLREFTQGLVDVLTEEVLVEKGKPNELLVPPAEIALALQAAALLILYKYEIPEEERRKTFIRQLMA